jgi:hypothetical protein
MRAYPATKAESPEWWAQTEHLTYARIGTPPGPIGRIATRVVCLPDTVDPRRSCP